MDDVTIAFRCPVKLAEKIDTYIHIGEYMNRGDAGRDLVRLGLQVKESEKSEKEQATNNSLCIPAD